MTLLILGIYVLAVARVTRLINFDTVLDRPRIAAAHIFGTESEVVYFLGCPWCVGFWVALASAIVPVRLLDWPWWAVFPVALAASHLVGVAAPLASTEELDIEDVEAD